MIVSIGINQLFLIGFFLNLKKNSFKAAAFIIAVTMLAGTSFIIYKRPWKLMRKFKNRNTEVVKLGGRKIWNRTKEVIETIDDIPEYDTLKAQQLAKRISRNVMSCMML
mmetsp:Transcript_18190/g.20930  ORF Transcript_18190/g.20930 Transcript_18190/m.20930 type:complete len:109 (+) Transcript_18190:795-1121(+)